MGANFLGREVHGTAESRLASAILKADFPEGGYIVRYDIYHDMQIVGYPDSEGTLGSTVDPW